MALTRIIPSWTPLLDSARSTSAVMFAYSRGLRVSNRRYSVWNFIELTDLPAVCGGARQRQAEVEGGAFAFFALETHSTTMALDDRVRDIETHAHPAVIVRRAGMGPVEALEDAGLLAVRDADATVAHRDDGLAIANVHGYVDLAA